MPSSRTFEEEEDAVPLADLLRTGEASRLRRRGAMRSGHRREDSEESIMPLSRRVRIDPARRHGDQRRDSQVYLELTCGVRTTHFPSEPSSSRQPSPLPQTRRSDPSFDLGFVYGSTGCGAVVNSVASPSQQGCSSAHQVYISTDTSNLEVVRLPSKYLDTEQRALAEFLSREDVACKCDWEPIGCRVCGNPLGFLYIPCHSDHSMDISRIGPHPTHVFFPSSVTPSPPYTFPPIDPALSRNLPRMAPPSESDDMSIDSPTFSPRVQAIPDEETVFRFRSQDPRVLDFFDFSQVNDPDLLPIPGTPSTQAHIAFPAVSEERSADYSHPESGFEPSHENRRFLPTEGRASARMSARHAYAASPRLRTSREISDDEWNAFLERDRTPSSTRRHLDADRSSQYPWVPRELRERPPGALAPGERAADRLATIRYPESPERAVPHFTIGAVSPTRAPDPPMLHRVPRRSLSTMAPSSRRTTSFDASSWRPRTVIPPGHSRPAHGPERQEHIRDGERGLRMSRWATMPSGNAHSRRRPAASASTPAFTLVDSAGERSYPPSAQSSLDDRDTLSVDSAADSYRMSSRHVYDYLHPAERYRDGGPWGDSVHTEDPDGDDEEKADDEQQAGEPAERARRSPTVGRSRELVLDEQSVSSVSQLPLG